MKTAIVNHFRSVVMVFAMFAICLMSLQATHASSILSTSYTASWMGIWECNLDGRPAVIRLGIEDINTCYGGICQRIIGAKLAGYVSDDEGPWVRIERRSFNSDDPPASVKDHLLPLRYNNKDDWMLMMHTWDRDYASGYTTWHGRPYGLQCRKIYPGDRCDSGMVYDCVGKCVSETKAESWIGDNYCDDGRYGMDLRCSEFDNDGDDCN